MNGKVLRMPNTPVPATPVSAELPAWIAQKWTLKRIGALLLFWIVALMMLPVLHICAMGMIGAVKGLGEGLVEGMHVAWKDIQKYWDMFLQCDNNSSEKDVPNA